MSAVQTVSSEPHLAARRTVAAAAAGPARVPPAIARAPASELAAQRLAAGHRLLEPPAGASPEHRRPADRRARPRVAALDAAVLPAAEQLVACVAAGGRKLIARQVLVRRLQCKGRARSQSPAPACYRPQT